MKAHHSYDLSPEEKRDFWIKFAAGAIGATVLLAALIAIGKYFF